MQIYLTYYLGLDFVLISLKILRANKSIIDFMRFVSYRFTERASTKVYETVFLPIHFQLQSADENVFQGRDDFEEATVSKRTEDPRGSTFSSLISAEEENC